MSESRRIQRLGSGMPVNVGPYTLADLPGKKMFISTCLAIAGFYLIPFILDPQKMNELLDSLNVMLLYNVQGSGGSEDFCIQLNDPERVHSGFIGTYFARYDVFYVRNALVDKSDRMMLNLIDFSAVRVAILGASNWVWGAKVSQQEFDRIWRENLRVIIALMDIFTFNFIKGVIYYKSLIFYTFAFIVVLVGHFSLPLEITKQVLGHSSGVF